MATTLTATNPVVFKCETPMETTDQYYILNGQSWKAGQFLYVDTSGLLKACASDADAGTGGIKFLALTDQDDPGNSTTKAEVGIITADMVFEMNELNGTVSQANLGQFYALDVTSNVCTVDVDDTSNDALELVALGYETNPALYDSTDIKAKVYCKVLTVAIEAAAA